MYVKCICLKVLCGLVHEDCITQMHKLSVASLVDEDLAVEDYTIVTGGLDGNLKVWCVLQRRQFDNRFLLTLLGIFHQRMALLICKRFFPMIPRATFVKLPIIRAGPLVLQAIEWP